MPKHIVKLEDFDINHKYGHDIAASYGSGSHKSLSIIFSMTKKSYFEVKDEDNVIYSGEDLLKAIEIYNNLP
jgi:hypothetical protein